MATDQLRLDDSGFTGTIPTEFGNMEQISKIHCNDHSLRSILYGVFVSVYALSTIPAWYSHLLLLPLINVIIAISDIVHNTAQLEIGENQFTGTLPSELGRFTLLGTCVRRSVQLIVRHVKRFGRHPLHDFHHSPFCVALMLPFTLVLFRFAPRRPGFERL